MTLAIGSSKATPGRRAPIGTFAPSLLVAVVLRAIVIAVAMGLFVLEATPSSGLLSLIAAALVLSLVDTYGAYRRQEATRTVVHAAFVFWLWLPGLTTAYANQGQVVAVYPSGLEVTVSDAIGAVGLIALAEWWFRLTAIRALRASQPRAASPTIDRLVPLGMAIVALGLVLVLEGGSITRLVEDLNPDRFSEKPWAAEGVESTSSTVVGNSAVYLLTAASAVWLYLSVLMPTRRSRYMYAIGGVSAVAIVLGMTGTRNYVIVAIGPAFILMLNRQWAGKDDPGRRRATLYLLAGLVLMAAYVSPLVREARAGVDRAPTGLSSVLDQDNDFFSATAAALQINATHGVSLEEPVLLGMLTVVPRFAWPGKPEGGVTELVTQSLWGVSTSTGGTTFVSIVGQYYLSLGLLGVVWLGIWLGVLSNWLDRRLLETPQGSVAHLRLALLPFVAFVSFRNLGAYAFTFLAVAGIGLVLGRLMTDALRRLGRTGRLYPLPNTGPQVYGEPVAVRPASLGQPKQARPEAQPDNRPVDGLE